MDYVHNKGIKMQIGKIYTQFVILIVTVAGEGVREKTRKKRGTFTL